MVELSYRDEVDALRGVFASGHTQALEWRRAQLEGLLRFLSEEEDAIAAALAQDLGKGPFEAWASETGFVAAEARHARKKLRRWMRPRRVATSLVHKPGKAYLRPEPLGVVLIIAPWNYPLQLALAPLVAALAAGNCAVVKPSELAPHTAALLAEALPRYLDGAAVQVVLGGRDESTALLRERFDHIFFTGGERVGRIVMRAAAEHLCPVTLELGGKSPALVDQSANLAVSARRIAWGKFLNAGQTCVAPDYVLCARSLMPGLIEALRQSVRAFYGEDPSESPDYGRIISDAHFARLTALLSQGEVLMGGQHDAATRYLAPTLMAEVPLDAPLMQEEIFGPLLPILPVDTLAEAMAFVNARPKPLALYVFAEDQGVAAQVIASTSSGGVCVNDTIMHLSVPDLPFGGVGPSGMGAYHGEAGFLALSHAKAVLARSTCCDVQMRYPPYRPEALRWMRRLL